MAESLAHSKRVCKYRLAFPQSIGEKQGAELKADIQQYIRDLRKWKGGEIVEGHMTPF